MPYSLAIGFGSRGARDRDEIRDRLRAADDSGVESAWVSESWGEDAFTLMGQIVAETKHIQVGSSIVNVFSRTLGALAQHFATLDNVSEGRMLIGLGASGANVIEQFHGLPFERPLQWLREYTEIINCLIAGEKLNYEGEIFRFNRGFTMNMEHRRDHIPVYFATLSPRSVRLTAEIADGWLPIWTPIEKLGGAVSAIREMSVAAGRPADAVRVRSAGGITLTKDVERVRAGVAGTFAFYIARMGVFYAKHLARLGYGELVAKIQKAWAEGGSGAGAGAVPPELQQSLTLVTDSVEQARERLAEEAAAGCTLHSVSVDADSPAELQRTYEALAQ